MSDQIDILSGLEPASELYGIRRERPDFVQGTEICREAVLRPHAGFGITHSMRTALAARMARMVGLGELASTYEALLEDEGNALLAAIAAGDDLPSTADRFTIALVRHADLVTKSPRDCTRADIERLEEAGLTNPQIIALSELIAFVNFEARVIAGLTVLEEIA